MSKFMRIGDDVYKIEPHQVIQQVYQHWLRERWAGVRPDLEIPYVKPMPYEAIIVFTRVVKDGTVCDIVANSFEIPKNIRSMLPVTYSSDADHIARMMSTFNYAKLGGGLYIIGSPNVVSFIYADWLSERRSTEKPGDIVEMLDLYGEPSYPMVVAISRFGGEHHLQPTTAEAVTLSPGIYRVMSQKGLFDAYQHYAFGKLSVEPLPDNFGADAAYPGVVTFHDNN